MRLDEALRSAAARLVDSGTPMLDARVLAMHALKLDEAGLISDSDRALTAAERARFEALIDRRARGEPVAYIVGRREFWSLEIEVEPGVLVPRPDTETLIEAAIGRCKAGDALKLLDLGCGTGAILCALLREFPNSEGQGVDVDAAAVALTNRNLDRLGLSRRGTAAAGDWFEGVCGAYDVIVSNPPYIPEGERDALPRDVRDFESPQALFSGADGLDAIRRLLSGAPARLSRQGLMIVEFGAGQANSVEGLARAAFPGALVEIVNDLAGRARAVVIDRKG